MVGMVVVVVLVVVAAAMVVAMVMMVKHAPAAAAAAAAATATAAGDIVDWHKAESKGPTVAACNTAVEASAAAGLDAVGNSRAGDAS